MKAFVGEDEQRFADEAVIAFMHEATVSRNVSSARAVAEIEGLLGNHPLIKSFHGDTARGVGASHQTGWTGLVAKLLQPRAPERGRRRRKS
jgi:hypothetical protein